MVSEDSRIVFIVGNSRSRTTLLAKILSRSEHVFSFEELHFFDHLWGSYQNERNLDVSAANYFLERLFSIQREGYLLKKSKENFESEALEILSELTAEHCPITPLSLFRRFLDYETHRQGKSIACEQTPRSLFFLDVILKEFSDAFIVNLIRDPRDVLLSQKYKWRVKFLGMSQIPCRESMRSLINYHPITISKLWTLAIRQVEKFEHENRIMNVYFERLLRSPSEVMREICRNLNIPFHKKMLDVEQIHSSTELNGPTKIGVDQSKIGKWKNGKLNDTEIYICQRICLYEMRRHGYTVCDVKPNYPLLMWYYVSFPFQITLAFLFNIKRTKNIFRSIARRLGSAT